MRAPFKIIKLDLLVVWKILQQSLLSNAVEEIGLLVVMLGKHHVQHDVANLVQQGGHVLDAETVSLKTPFPISTMAFSYFFHHNIIFMIHLSD